MGIEELRRVVQEIGRANNRPGLADNIIEGRLTADDAAPLVAGMIEGLFINVVIPITCAVGWSGFDPHVRPVVGRLTMQDGSVLEITLKQMD